MRLLSLALGGPLVDAVGVQPLFWTGGALLVAAGGLGLILVCADDLRVSGASCLTGEGVTTPRGVAHDFASRQSDRTHR